MRESDLRAIAYRHLSGVGDSTLGEWTEFTGYAFHLRRRLKPAEEALVGPAVDLRGTPEGKERFERLRPLIPPHGLPMALQELGETCK